jgi:hypothetical protein
MGDLRVTDLQGILRSYANAGHDITQSPYQVHINDKPYGMVIGHSMHIDRNGSTDASALESYVMQAERPVVSRIGMSSYGSVHPGQGRYANRGVTPLHRLINGIGSHLYDTLYLPNRRSDGDHDEELYNSGEHKGLWTPRSSMYTDMHEALQAHTSQAVPNVGHVRKIREENRAMTREEHGSFRDTEAFRDLTDVKPFAGLLHLSYSTTPDSSTRGTQYYTYDHQTEELKGPRFWGEKHDD